jgi:hypothetical protein
MSSYVKTILQDARYYVGFLPEKAMLAFKCEVSRVTKSATGIVDNCGTCRICHSIRSAVKALAFAGIATVSPTLGVLLLALYFIAAE